MERLDAVYSVDDFVRRVVDSLVRARRGTFLCARCLVKLTKDNLDKSYAKPDIVRVIDDLFGAPGSIPHAPAATCGQCQRKKVPCLGGPAPERGPR